MAKQKHKWVFVSRFRRGVFGWRSDVPIKRIKEAMTEIRGVSRKDPVLAGEGAVLFLEKIAPALEHVDSSSGAIGNAVNSAIEMLVPFIKCAPVSPSERQKWLERLWSAIQEDRMPYIEYLGDFWGEMCATPEMASLWVGELIDLARHIWSQQVTGYNFFKGTVPCLSALYFSERFEELLSLLETAPYKMWHYRKWGVKALVSLGKLEDALDYARDTKGLNVPTGQIARACEEILIAQGRNDEAYAHYSFEANRSTTHLATFRSLVKKYSDRNPGEILENLIDQSPGEEGKWFAAAKSAGLYDVAVRLVSERPTDPRTLARAARDFAEKNPPFAIETGIASLRWIAEGYGYEITGADVYQAYSSVLSAAEHGGVSADSIHQRIKGILSEETPSSRFIRSVIGDNF